MVLAFLAGGLLMRAWRRAAPTGPPAAGPGPAPAPAAPPPAQVTAPLPRVVAPAPAPPARRRQPAPTGLDGAAPAIGVAAGVALCVSAFLPWYAADLGAPFTSVSTSGWDATRAAQALVPLGALVALAGLALAVPLGRPGKVHRALTAVLLGAATAAVALVAWRLVWIPEPSDLLSRQGGLWLALVAALAAAGAGALMVGRGPPSRG
jgi:hypothetical protein